MIMSEERPIPPPGEERKETGIPGVPRQPMQGTGSTMIPPGTPSALPPGGAPQGRTRRRGWPRGAKIALGVGIAVLALIIIMVIVVVFVVVGFLTEPIDVANNFMKAISRGNVSQAWDYMHSAYQEEYGRSSLETTIEPLEGNIEDYNSGSVSLEGGNAEVEMDFTLDNGEEYTWYIYMSKDDGDWKIEEFSPFRDPTFDRDDALEIDDWD